MDLKSKPDRFRRVITNAPDRLKLLLNQFNNNYYQIITQHKHKSDTENFRHLANITKKEHYPFNSKKIMEFVPFIEPGMNILDFGGSSGEIANKIQELKTNVTVADVTIPHKKFPTVKYVEIKDDNKLPFKKDEFDATCCFMVLHHVQNFAAIVKEIARVTKKFLFVQEHNATDQKDIDLIDIQHGIYMYVTQTDDYDKTKSFDDWKAFYFSAETLDKELQKYGFKKISFRMSTRSGYTTKNYFAIYVKV